MEIDIISNPVLRSTPIPLRSIDMDRIGVMLVCPVCDFEWVHIVEHITLTDPNEDDGAAGFVRGPATRLHFYCESNHHFSIDFGFHKGTTYIRVAPDWEYIIGECDQCKNSHWYVSGPASQR